MEVPDNVVEEFQVMRNTLRRIEAKRFKNDLNLDVELHALDISANTLAALLGVHDDPENHPQAMQTRVQMGEEVDLSTRREPFNPTPRSELPPARAMQHRHPGGTNPPPFNTPGALAGAALARTPDGSGKAPQPTNDEEDDSAEAAEVA